MQRHLCISVTTFFILCISNSLLIMNLISICISSHLLNVRFRYIYSISLCLRQELALYYWMARQRERTAQNWNYMNNAWMIVFRAMGQILQAIEAQMPIYSIFNCGETMEWGILCTRMVQVWVCQDWKWIWNTYESMVEQYYTCQDYYWNVNQSELLFFNFCIKADERDHWIKAF